MNDQVKETIEKHNSITKLGEYGVQGGPGRPQGLKNKFTLIKQDMLEVWEEENGKERFRELFKGSPSDFMKALEKIVAILPKESVGDLETSSPEARQIVLIRYQKENESK